MTLEEIIALPKDNPMRFWLLWGTVPDDMPPPSIREAERFLWRIKHPFASDLEAIASTNS